MLRKLKRQNKHKRLKKSELLNKSRWQRKQPGWLKMQESPKREKWKSKNRRN